MAIVRSVEKALRILQTLDIGGEWIGVRKLARLIGQTPPTTHNLLQTLRASSFVEFNPDTKQYRLGLAAIRLGEGANALSSMKGFVRPYLESLSSEFDETVAVLAWDKDEAVAIDWIQADHPLAVIHEHGVVEHPILMASGRVLLAYQDRATQLRYAAREDLSRLGPNSPRTTEELIQLLDQIARDGFAITDNVNNSGVIALAAPVFDARKQLAASVGSGAPLSRSNDTKLETVQRRLIEVASLMTQKLGGNGTAWTSGVDPQAS